MPAAVLPLIDRAAFAAAFAARLRARGMSVGLTGIEDFARALAVSPPASTGDLYWCARISLVRHRTEIEVFDAVFTAVFADAVLALDPHARRGTGTLPPGRADDVYAPLPAANGVEQAGAALPWATLPHAVGRADDADTGQVLPERLPSELDGLADVPFEDLGPEDMKLFTGWLAEAVARWPVRRGRRRRVDAAGHRIALRATVRRARTTGWEPVCLVRERAVDKPRRVIMLCDVSQSMQSQVPAYFHLMRALAQVAHTDVFAFATTLTRLTPTLAHRSAEYAISRATDEVTDRFGGTRIATNIRALLASAHGTRTRGAVVLIASDGWDSDPPDELAAAMVRLRRRAHRVIWMNPRAGAHGFEPKVASMAAALPSCDALVPADTFRALRDVIGRLCDDAGGRRAR
ncbi:MAG TPA: VWA domain-containing protein [Streptosporangiaceae bacterium]|jgi:hypothetical protein